MNRDLLYLTDMLHACDKVARFIAGGREAFMQDDRTQDAVIRNIEIIGEASKALSSETKNRAPEEPWVEIRRMRDKMAHHYFGVILERVWYTASITLPTFRTTVARLLAEVERKSDAPPQDDRR